MPSRAYCGNCGNWVGNVARVHYLSADFSHLGQAADLATRIRTIASSIDLLVNNAGFPGARNAK